VADAQALAHRAEQHLLVGDQALEAHGVHGDRAGPATAGALHDLVLGRILDPVVGGGGHALGGQHGGARRGVDLLVVVELDDLGRLEERRGHLGEAHHQHGADGEVGGDDAVALGELLGQPGVVLLAEAGGADHGVDPVGGEPVQVRLRRLLDGEVDGDVDRAGVEALGGRADHDVAEGLVPGDLPQLEAGVVGVDGGDQLELVVAGHGRTHRGAHPTTGAEHRHPE
jgi:hypothetical protein